MNTIDTSMTAKRMRSRIVRPDARSILVSRLSGSAQEPDLTVPPNCGGIGRIRHFRRDTSSNWPDNPLPIDPAAFALGLPATDILRAQVFQNAACAWRCWFCYVPFELLAGDEKRSEWVTAKELVSRYRAINDRPIIIDLTGGSPDLTPEWPLWMMEELMASGLSDETYLWSDDNLSTDYHFEILSSRQRTAIASYRKYGRVCCFKGFDEASFSFNTTAEGSSYERQFSRFAAYLDAGIDLYAYVTLTGPSTHDVFGKMEKFVDRLQAVSMSLPLRTVPLRIEPFGPLLARRQTRDVEEAMVVQENAISAWNSIVEDRFSVDDRMGNIAEVKL